MTQAEGRTGNGAWLILAFPTFFIAGAKDVGETPASQQQSNQPSGGELVGLWKHARPNLMV